MLFVSSGLLRRVPLLKPTHGHRAKDEEDARAAQGDGLRRVVVIVVVVVGALGGGWAKRVSVRASE